jgi:methylglyoxal synthase
VTPSEPSGLQQIGYEISQQELDALVFLLDVDSILDHSGLEYLKTP